MKWSFQFCVLIIVPNGISWLLRLKSSLFSFLAAEKANMQAEKVFFRNHHIYDLVAFLDGGYLKVLIGKLQDKDKASRAEFTDLVLELSVLELIDSRVSIHDEN